VSEAAWQRAARLLRARVANTAAAVGDRFPRHADPPTGEWTTTQDGDWTGGFWVSMCWLSARDAADGRYARWAREFAERLHLRPASSPATAGLHGYYGALVGAVVGGDAGARAMALAAAREMASTFDPRVGFCTDGSGETTIASVPAVALLAWAARESGRPEWQAIATSHARRHGGLCLRPSGAVWSSVAFTPATGEVVRRFSRKGLHDNSAWARGQAWAILGYTLLHQWTGEADFRDIAQGAADWWLANSSHDHVAFWDFDDPASFNATRDTSASAIVAAALLKLAAVAPEPRAAVYRREAEAIVTALAERFLDQRGVLSHGCDDKPQKVATKHELIWGSYYLLEAVEVLAGGLSPTDI
jgi:unsaturated chondroitin disaccharide hydrolase